jgi:hypothetical protein
MNFIKVTADQCNQQGQTSPQIPRSEFHLNIDLIGAIKGNSILLKGSEIINLGGSWYKNIILAQGERIPN